MATLLADKVASAGVPASVLSATIKAAGLLAAGQAAAGAISFPVAALTEGVLKTMLVAKLKMTSLFLLTLGMIGLGTTVLTYRTLASPQDSPRNPLVQADDKPAQTVPTSRKKSAAEPRAGKPEEANLTKPDEGRSGDNDKVRALLKQRLDLLRKNTDRLRQAHREGTVSEESVRHAELRLYKAELDLCETRQARIDVLNKIVSVYQEMEERMAQQVKQGVVAPEVVNEATINRLEAEIALEREKAKSR